MARSIQIAFDARDPGRLAEFWAVALGYQLKPPPEGYESWEAWAVEMNIPEERWNDVAALIDPDGGPRLYFQRVPEGKTAKNRVHLDIKVAVDLPPSERQAAVDAEASRLVEAGATRIGPIEEQGAYWMVMQDPEGNEFCVE